MKLLIHDHSEIKLINMGFNVWYQESYSMRDMLTHDIVAVKLKKGYEIVKHRFGQPQKFTTKRAFLAHIAKYM